MTHYRLRALSFLILAGLTLHASAVELPTLQDCVLQTCALSQPACRPGYGITAKFQWDAQPLKTEYKPFVHILNSDGKMVFQAEYELSISTTLWKGDETDDVFINVPPDLPVGQYSIVAGLWEPQGQTRQPLFPGEGVTDLGDKSYQVGTFQVKEDAPLPKLPAPTLNLAAFKLTFDEDFKEPLSVSAQGPGTRWTAHMPENLNFGEGKFADPTPDFPFTVENGVLRIEAAKRDGHWQSGLLSSSDHDGNGFAQQYGYFECRAKLPKGEGVWPAFWLMRQPDPKVKGVARIEIDVMEHFGARPNALSSSVHFWGPEKAHRVVHHGLAVSGMTEDYHNYGVLIDPDQTVFYFDGVEHWRMKTPDEAKVPLFLMVDLALGSGWPTARTPDPSFLWIDYIRAYERN